MKKVREFFVGVKKEMAKVHWPTKKEMTKYSVATLGFIFIYSIFFLLSDFIIAILKTLVN
jgi:preprotein translocase subunit SecE